MKQLLRGEDGIALAVALGVLSVLMILVTFVFAGSYALSSTSTESRDSKRAFQAAEAGLQVAIYRLNNLAPLADQCIATTAQIPVAGGCEAEGDIASGTTWEYHMTPVLNGGECAGYLLQLSDGVSELAPRCITVTGSAGQVKRRVQARVVLLKGNAIFPLAGITGLSGVEVGGTATVTGKIGSNGLVEVGNDSTVSGGISLGPAAPSPEAGNSSISVSYRTPDDGGYVLAPVEIGNSATVNSNGDWSVSSGAVWSYDAVTRALNVTKGTLTLLGGTYNFCSITTGTQGRIAVAGGGRARVFIDSPERGTGSGCAAGTGYVEAGSGFGNPGAPEDLQLYVYGSDPSTSKPAVEFKGSSGLNMAIHAPRATVRFKQSTTLHGGVSANRVVFEQNVNHTWASTLEALRGVTSLLYQRTGWRECRRAAAGSDPASGC